MDEPKGELLEAKTDEELLKRLDDIQKQLAALTDLLRRLPETQAAVFFQMEEEKNKAAMQGRRTSDIWTIAPPEKR